MIPFPDISPEIVVIPIFGTELAIRWYAMAYLAGLLIGWAVVAALMRRPRLWGDAAPMRAEDVEALLTWIVLGVVVGGRLGFVLFYQWPHYAANPGQILKVWQGGMSFHGGLLGVVVATAIYAWRGGLPALRLADALVVAAPFGLFLGRIANFINAELWGRPTSLPWGVVFPGAAAQDCPGVEGLCARHPSQLYEAGLEGLLLGLVLWGVVRRGGLRRPGLAFGVFLSGYGLARLLVEGVRQADPQFMSADNPLGYVIGGHAWGLSMGQVLSLPMIALGLWLIWRAVAHPERK